MSNLTVKDINRTITTKGYGIKKTSLTKEEIVQLRKDLTVSPVTNVKFSAMSGASAFPVYMESSIRFYVPRMWGITHFGQPDSIILPEGLPLADNITFKGIAYDYQESIINKFISSGSTGLISVPCGKGKTFMALNIAVRLKKRFLVVVDKSFLLNQWKKEIEGFIEGIRIGIVQGTKCEVDPNKYDVTLCMIQTLCSRDFPESTFASYGFTIFDECHHLGASYFSRTLMKIQTKYLLGLSATPTRDDGLSRVFEWYLGGHVYWEKTREADKTVIVRGIKYENDNPLYTDLQTNDSGELIMARMLTKVVEFLPRNEFIVKILMDLAKDPLRKILVLSERIEHLKTIEELVNKRNNTIHNTIHNTIPLSIKIGYYIGGMKDEKRETDAKTSNILLASYSMASEAMNIKELNCVILTSPRKKVEQSTGRILRQRKEERLVDPIIVDIIDQHGIYQHQWRTRFQYYKQCGYKIERSGGSKKENNYEDNKDDNKDYNKYDNKDVKECLILDD